MVLEVVGCALGKFLILKSFEVDKIDFGQGRFRRRMRIPSVPLDSKYYFWVSGAITLEFGSRVF